MEVQRQMKPQGGVALRVLPPGWRPEPPALLQSRVPARELTLREIYHYGFPRRYQRRVVTDWRRANFRHLFPGLRRVLVARALHLPHFYGQLALAVFAPDGTLDTDLGLASTRVVTTAGVGALVDAFQGLLSLNLFRFHALGTGGTAPVVGDTALASELSSQYSPTAGTRATGTLEESGGNTFVTVGVNTLGTTTSIVEHSVFNQALAGGGVCWDRSVFSSQTVIAGFSLSSTYSLVINPGG